MLVLKKYVLEIVRCYIPLESKELFKKLLKKFESFMNHSATLTECLEFYDDIDLNTLQGKNFIR